MRESLFQFLGRVIRFLLEYCVWLFSEYTFDKYLYYCLVYCELYIIFHSCHSRVKKVFCSRGFLGFFLSCTLLYVFCLNLYYLKAVWMNKIIEIVNKIFIRTHTFCSIPSNCNFSNLYYPADLIIVWTGRYVWWLQEGVACSHFLIWMLLCVCKGSFDTLYIFSILSFDFHFKMFWVLRPLVLY